MNKLLILLPLLLLGACSETQETRNIMPQPNLTYEPEHTGNANIDWDTVITPQAYAIVASRTVNRMLDGSKNIYEHQAHPSLYIMEPQKEDENLPNGFYYARGLIQDTIEGSRTYKVVNHMDDADYILESVVSEQGHSDKPIIAYTLILTDSRHHVINQWTETLRPVDNDDKSWW